MKMKTKSDHFSRHFGAGTILLLNLFSGVISQNVGDVRLVDEDGVTGSNAGRVEVYRNTGRRQYEWARLCDNKWNMNVASIVCRQLGFGLVDSFYSSSYSGSGTQRVIRLDRCMRNTDAATLNDARCEILNGGRPCNNKPDAGVSCLTLPRTSLPPLPPLPPLDNQNPTLPVIADRLTTSNRMTSTHPITTKQIMSTSSRQSTSSTSTTLVSTSMTSNITGTTGTSDGITTNATDTGIQIPRNEKRNIAAIYSGVSIMLFIIAMIVIIIFLRHWRKRKSAAAKKPQGSQDREDNEYQYTAVGTVENGPTEPRILSSITVDEYQYSPIGQSLDINKDATARVPKQESVDEYEYSAVGPIQSGTKTEARIPKQESIDEYQYSAVGPIYSDADVEPRVPKQDSVDEYQYSAVGPIGSDDGPRVPTEDLGDESFYAPVGANSSDTLTPKATAFANVCTDESLYTIPDRSEDKPYQQLTVTTTTFAGLQKLKRKPVLEQNAPRVPDGDIVKHSPGTPKKPFLEQNAPIVQKGNLAKHPQGKPKKPLRKSVLQTDDSPVHKPAVGHQPHELDNAVYGLEMMGASSTYDGQSDDQHESIYANDIELQQLPSSAINDSSRDSKIEGNVIKDGENPYENSIIGDESYLQQEEDSAYQALSRKATLPV